MNQNSKLYRLTSTLLAAAMLLQLLAPLMMTPTAVSAAPATTNSRQETANKEQTTGPVSPLSISRQQSTAVSGEEIVVTYTIVNNQPPTLDSEIPIGATVTDTVDILSAVVLTDDMNTIHNPTLAVTLTNGVLVDGNGATQNGAALVWTLDDILPMDSAVVTVTVAAPLSAPDFVELDTGAMATAVLHNTPIAAIAPPALVIPDAVDPAYIAATVDADSADGDMLWATAQFNQDPIAAFQMAQPFAYDPYKGSLRGTRGTLWGEAGNSVDQSSLLIAMLRSAGVPARYRHGQLDVANAQILLASMFDAQQGVAGYLPDDEPLADPLNDPNLLALAQDHWWVEAYLPGMGWTDLDPTFPETAVGDRVATPTNNDQIAEIPDDLRHAVHMELEIEQYNSFPIGGVSLTTAVPLTATFSAAQIAGKAVILGHLLNTDTPPGLIFSSVEHTYTPYFGVNGDQYVELGEPFSDLMTSFPLASHFTTAAWIHFELIDADGNSETFTREVRDNIGVSARLLGGTADISSPADDAPFFGLEDAFVADFLPNFTRNQRYAQRQEATLHYDVFRLAQAVNAVPRDDEIDTPEADLAAEEARYQGEITRALLYSLTGLDFAFQADALADNLSENLRVKLFYDQSRVIVMHGTSAEESATRTIDLRNTNAQAIVAPDQAASAARTAQWVKAVAESYFEGEALRDTSGQTAVTVAHIFEEAQLQGIDFVYIKPDQLDLLDLYLPDPVAYGHAAAALIAGKEVLIPTAQVSVDGDLRLGWWEIDPETGTAVSVLDNGLHGALMEYATMIKKIVAKLKKTWKEFGKSVDQLWNDCIVDNVVPALQGGAGGSGAACLDDWKPPNPGPLRPAASAAAPWYYLPDHLCPTGNCGMEQFLLDGYTHAQMPLPEAIFQYAEDQATAQSYAGQLLAVTDDGSGGAPAFTLLPSGAATILPLQTYGLDITAVANFDGDLEVWAYVPDGWSVGFLDTNQLQIVAPENTPAGDYAIRIVGQASDNRALIAAAEHIVAVPTQEAIDLSYESEPNITVNLGASAYDAVSNQTNDAEAEIPDSAYKLYLVNNSSISKTINLSVSGAPADWTVLDGAKQTTTNVPLDPFSRTRVGLYLKPDSVPAPGTNFVMTVVASDGGSLSDNVNIAWTMPGQAHNFMEITPQTLYLPTDGAIDFELSMHNVGNAAGAFPITATAPISTWQITGLPPSITLNVDESASVTGTLSIIGGEVGREYPLIFASSAPDSYTQYELATAVIVSPLAAPVFSAANSCNMGSDGLSASLEALAFAVSDLESGCNAGVCDLEQRDAVVSAANSVADYARIANGAVSYAAIETIAAAMETHSDPLNLLADLDALGTAVGVLSAELCDLERHQPSARFTPYVDAILLGDSASFALELTNNGALSTTYAITVTGLPDGDQLFNETLNAGEAISLSINSTPVLLGAFDVQATAVAVGDYTLIPEDTAVARLNVVDKFLQVTQVAADPAFVETGVSSTTLSVEIANVAGVVWPANARTAVYDSNGSQQWTQDIPLTVLAGNPRWYNLTALDTSGWAEGVYTVTIDLLDGSGVLIPDGSGYGYFSVGQALIASHAIAPDVVAPGTVTVTTIVTTALTAGSVPPPLRPQPETGNGEQGAGYPAEFLATLPVSDPDSLTDGLRLDALYLAYREQLIMNNEQVTSNSSSPSARALTPIHVEVEETAVVNEAEPTSQLTSNNSLLTINSVFTRTEQSDPAVVYTGTWPVYTTDRVSGGSYQRADTAGETAVFAFTGDWLNIGFLGTIQSGQADIAIDGVSQGTVDLYRRSDTAISFVYDNLISGTHTVTVTALGIKNPYASNDYVQLDYFDAWDSSTLPDGTFEQNDQRVIRSTGWTTYTDAVASGGSYIRDNVGTVWFPFTGDSFSYHAIGRSGINHTRLVVDGRFLTNLNTTNFDTVTHTYSYNGFGAGPHILQVSAYRGTSDVDAFATPAIAPINNPELTGSYIRYEEDHPNWLYNGVPYTQTAQSWTRRDYLTGDISSDDQATFSNMGGNTAVLTVNGEWINIGFAATNSSGSADIYLDGAYQRTIDLYRHHDSVTSAFFPALSAEDHTISVTVVGDGDVWIDYVDVWDGTALPDGTYESFPGQFYLSGGWSRSNNASAINGSYLRATGGTVWFPFTGDSVSYRAFAYNSAGNARLYIDDQFMDTLDLFNSSIVSRTFSFDGLGAGAHMLRLEDHHGTVTLEDFSAPAISPIYNPPVPSGIIRYEEDNPALRYNGLPLTQTVASWDDSTYAQYASEGYYADSSTMGDNVSLEFNGTWVGVGFLTWRTRGMADIYLDGNLIDTVDLFTHKQDTKSVYYDSLTNSSHTISVTVRGESHPNAVGTEIAIDYIDVWDGALEADGTFEETARDRILYSYGWAEISEAGASGGGYADTGISADVTAWFPFTGDSVSYQAWARRNTHLIEIKIDGVPVASNGQTHFDIFADVPVSRTFSFDGLGAGAHVLEINQYRDDLTLDNFSAPGIAPFYTPPITPTGVVRYEEDHPALLYNGYPLEQTPYCFYCWWTAVDAGSSGNAISQSREVGDWVELTFDGRWAGVGFATGTYGGVVEVFIDGTSMTTVTLTSPQDVTSVYFDNLITGTHTISASLVSGRMYFDFFDVWDGAEMSDGWFDADLDEHNGPYYYSDLNSWYTLLPTDLFAERIQYAYNDDVLDRGAVSSNTHLWFGFTGNDLEFLPFQKAGDTVEVFIDGISQGVIDLTPEYSDQPIAVYYTDLGEGAHMVHLDASDSPRIDAFQVNPPNLLPYTPQVEWMDDAPTDVYTTTVANGGLLSSSAIGDLDGDGLVEIVSPSSNGQLYVYRGDGLDAGGGSPLLWQSDLVGMPAEPALADLDGDGKAEIIVVGSDGTAVFHHDGSLYWFTDTIKSEVQNLGWGGASIANLDLEPSPEIVLAANNDALYVLDHDGTILFSEPTGAFPAIPTLADITGDGFLDIIFAQEKTITAYDAVNGYNIAWTRTHTYAGFYGQAFGSPVAVDVDGKQPGGDDGPEVVVNWGQYVDVLDADGSFLWHYDLGDDNYYRPSPITVADLDGDNEIELLTASALKSGFLVLNHLLAAINADGTLLWSQEMGDTTASASGVSTQDLDGDGVWEVLWNGYNEGFTILDGRTGERLFNEEATESGTVLDYPAVGDVDGDGYAEVATGGQNGLFVIGFDGVWGDSRPLWNQHNYHVTNINDDWSVPVSEPNSWDIHNTYRTQTPDRSPTPAYRVNVTYTAGIENVTVLTPTASISVTAAPPTYTWSYHQEWVQPIVTTTVDSVLSDLQAGETRLVAEGTQIAYRVPSGYNYLTLPPLYATASHIVAIAPETRTVWAGQTAVYTLTLANPAANTDTYTLAINGVPSDWIDAPPSVPIAPNSVISVPISVTVPQEAAIDTVPIIVDATTGSGGTDSALAYLSIGNGVQLTLSPTTQNAYVGVPVSYTVTVHNLDAVLHNFALTATGLADIVMPASIGVLGGAQESVTIQATPTAVGAQPFVIQATAENGMGKSVDGAVVGVPVGVDLALAPDPAATGIGSTAVFTLTVTNSGDTMETFDLIPAAPAGWGVELTANGTAVDSVTLPPNSFNSAELLLLATTDGATTAGNYAVEVTAVSQNAPSATATISGTVEVLPLGVQAAIISGPTAVDPLGSAMWEIEITNSGTVADTFDLQLAGVFSLTAQLSTETVSLAAGQSQTVQATTDNLSFLLPQTYPLVVAATSQTDGRVQHQDRLDVTVNNIEAVELLWQPPSQTVTDTLSAGFTLIVSNTGNIATAYALNLNTSTTIDNEGINAITLPAHSAANFPILTTAPTIGVYPIEAAALSDSGMASGEETAVLTVTVSVFPALTLDIAISGNDALLTWQPEPSYYTGYEMLYSLDPYFQANDGGVTIVSTPALDNWLHSGAAADVDNNYCYLLRGATSVSTGGDLPVSNRKCEFTFAITPGS